MTWTDALNLTLVQTQLQKAKAAASTYAALSLSVLTA